MLSFSVGTAGPNMLHFFEATPGYPDKIINLSKNFKKKSSPSPGEPKSRICCRNFLICNKFFP